MEKDVSKTQINNIEWIGDPVENDGPKKYYLSVSKDGIVYNIDDIVYIKIGYKEKIGKILKMWEFTAKNSTVTFWFIARGCMEIGGTSSSGVDESNHHLELILRKCTLKHIKEIIRKDDYPSSPVTRSSALLKNDKPRHSSDRNQDNPRIIKDVNIENLTPTKKKESLKRTSIDKSKKRSASSTYPIESTKKLKTNNGSSIAKTVQINKRNTIKSQVNLTEFPVTTKTHPYSCICEKLFENSQKKSSTL